MKYDLHCHSHYSDGDLSPSAVIELAVEREVTHLALTDHDTLAGLPEAKKAANQHNIQLINGVELSCTWHGQLLHVLGLNVDPDNESLQQATKNNIQRRIDRAEKMFIDFEQHEIDLRDSVKKILQQHAVPTRPHFAQALIDQGYAKNKNQAFKRYLVKGKPGYIPMEWPDLEQTAEAINAASGIAVLAHPMRYKFTRTRLIKLIEDMMAVGVKGIEVSTPTTDASQMSMLSRLAMQYELFASVGSDFHSPNQPWAKLGIVTDLPRELTPVWTNFN